MNCLPKNAAQRRYYWRFGPAMGLYVVFLFGAVFAIKHAHVNGAMAYGLALLPALPILAVLVIVGMYLMEEPDEFERTVMVQAMLWAMGGVLALTTVWGFLEMFAEAAPQTMPVAHLQPFWLFPLFWALVGVSTPLVRWRYR